MKPEEITATLYRILEDEFEVEPDRLHKKADLYEEIELDSLDAVDLVVALEGALQIQIPEEEMRQTRTLEALSSLLFQIIHNQT